MTLRRTTKKTQTFRCASCAKLVRRWKVGAGLCRACSQSKNAGSRTNYVRRGETKPCATCGAEMYVSPFEALRGRRFCSSACMGVAMRTVRVCSVCGSEFTSVGVPRKTCSARCLRTVKSRAKLGKKNPNYTLGESSTARRETWRSAAEDCCRLCPSSDQLRLHHVVYEQHVRKRGGDVLDPDNSFTACLSCHSKHHNGADYRIKVSQLRSENVDFAFALLGAYAFDYFTRYYENDRKDETWERAKGLAEAA